MITSTRFPTPILSVRHTRQSHLAWSLESRKAVNELLSLPDERIKLYMIPTQCAPLRLPENVTWSIRMSVGHPPCVHLLIRKRWSRRMHQTARSSSMA
ncbi:hypothetical protein VTH06DRAFT_575 [Thermothelomyces fergusii]